MKLARLFLSGFAVCATIILCGGCATLGPQPPQVAPSLSETIAGVAQWDYGRDRAPLVAVEQALAACRTATQRAAAETALLSLACDVRATRAARQFALQQLGRFGTSASISKLLELLTDADLALDAVSTLERMDLPEVSERLRAELPNLPAPQQAYVLRILGTHADRRSVSVVEPFLRSDDVALATLAVRALGRISSASAADSLIRHVEVAARTARDGGWDAMLSCLDAAVARGDRLTAERCIVAMDGAGAPHHVRSAAALITTAAAPPNEQLYRALIMLGSTNGAMQVAGVEILRRYADRNSLARAAGALALMPASSQIALLGLIEDRAVPKTEHLIRPLLVSSEPTVQSAALQTLGAVGTTASVAVLAQAAAEGTEATRTAARRALRRIAGRGIDAQFQALLQSTQGEVQLELLRAIGDRGVQSLATTLLKLTSASNDKLRREAIRQAGALARPSDWPQLLDGLLNATSEPDTAAWLDAAEAAALRTPRAADEVQSRWKTVVTASARGSLLSLAGRLRSPQLLPMVTEAAGSKCTVERTAAIRALSAWAEPSVLPSLMAAAQHSDANTRRLAQRGLLQVLRQSKALSPTERVARAAEIASLLEQPDEQKALLSILADASSLAAVQVAAQFLEQPAVRAEAELAILRAARSLPIHDAPSVRAALRRIATESEAADRRAEAAVLLQSLTP